MAENLSEAPPLGLGNWTHLLDSNSIAYGSLSLLIVSVELLGPLDDFLVLCMRHSRIELDHNRLIHSRGDYVAYSLLSQTLLLFCIGHWLRNYCCLRSYSADAP